jgi:deoxyribodipyrimidine photo-lyase
MVAAHELPFCHVKRAFRSMSRIGSPVLVWFRLDLRLEDNPAVQAAVAQGGPVLPVFIWAPDEEGDWAPGGASRWWLHNALAALDAALHACGSQLILRTGPSLETLLELIRATGAKAVFWNRRYEPAAMAQEKRIEAALSEQGLHTGSFNASLLHEPWVARTQAGGPFRVFTPFWRHCLGLGEPPQPLPAPSTLPTPRRWPRSLNLAALELLPKPDWASGLRSAWRPGAEAAGQRLEQFLDQAFDQYEAQRDRPDLPGTSRLSPHLHFGEISPRQIWHALRRRAERCGWPPARWRRSQFVTELGWREFAYHLLYHFPRTPHEPLRSQFSRFPWRRDPEGLRAWQRGRTGYPIVDAGMRDLWATGWMHNRVRMIVASFLVKDLLLPWQEGARWFWDTLVDSDLASNTLGWQWCAGCGADAAPFFRIFNPNLQGEKFDPHGDYIRRWCPELARLPVRWIHRPHEAPAGVLRAAGVTLGRTYPEPIVPHGLARERALAAFARMRFWARAPSHKPG